MPCLTHIHSLMEHTCSAHSTVDLIGWDHLQKHATCHCSMDAYITCTLYARTTSQFNHLLQFAAASWFPAQCPHIAPTRPGTHCMPGVQIVSLDDAHATSTDTPPHHHSHDSAKSKPASTSILVLQSLLRTHPMWLKHAVKVFISCLRKNIHPAMQWLQLVIRAEPASLLVIPGYAQPRSARVIPKPQVAY